MKIPVYLGHYIENILGPTFTLFFQVLKQGLPLGASTRVSPSGVALGSELEPKLQNSQDPIFLRKSGFSQINGNSNE
jgi:hypothetical protein